MTGVVVRVDQVVQHVQVAAGLVRRKVMKHAILQHSIESFDNTSLEILIFACVVVNVVLICQSLKVRILEFCSFVHLHHVESQISEYPFECGRHLTTGLGFQRYHPGRLGKHVDGGQQKSMSVVVSSDA